MRIVFMTGCRTVLEVPRHSEPGASAQRYWTSSASLVPGWESHDVSCSESRQFVWQRPDFFIIVLATVL
jgi:hypothetical protein